MSTQTNARKMRRKICGNCHYWTMIGFNEGFCDHPNTHKNDKGGYWQSCDWFKLERQVNDESRG